PRGADPPRPGPSTGSHPPCSETSAGPCAGRRPDRSNGTANGQTAADGPSRSSEHACDPWPSGTRLHATTSNEARQVSLSDAHVAADLDIGAPPPCAQPAAKSRLRDA